MLATQYIMPQRDLSASEHHFEGTRTRFGDHLRAGVISGPVQFRHSVNGLNKIKGAIQTEVSTVFLYILLDAFS